MGVRYHGIFTDSRNSSGEFRTYRVLFDFTGYAGSSSEVRMGSRAMVIDQVGSKEDLVGVVELRADFEITNGRAAVSSEDFFTENEKSIRCTVQRMDPAGPFAPGSGTVLETIFVGYVTPRQSEDPYHDGAKTIRVSATDGIAYLKNEKFITDGGYVLEGINTWLFVFKAVLDKIGLTLPFTTVGSLRQNGHDASGTFEPMAFTNHSLARYASMTYYEVLQIVATHWNARIVQHSGEWWMVRLYDLPEIVHYRKWAANGTYISGGTYAGNQTAEHNGPLQPLSGGVMSYDLSVKKLVGTLELGGYRNKLQNAKFQNMTGADISNWSETHSPVVTRIGTGTALDPYKAKLAGNHAAFIDAPFIWQIVSLGTGDEAIKNRIRFRGRVEINDVKSVAIRVNLVVAGFDFPLVYSLNDEGKWVRGQNEAIVYDHLDSNGKSKKSPLTIEVLSDKISEIPDIIYRGDVIKQEDWGAVSVEVRLMEGIGEATTLWGGSADYWVQYYDIGLEIVNEALNMNTTEVKYTLTNDAASMKDEELKLYFADMPDADQDSAMLDASENITTSNWITTGDTTQREIVEHLMRERLAIYSKPPRFFDGDIWGHVHPLKAVELAGEDGLFVPLQVKYDYAAAKASGRWIRLRQPNDAGGMTMAKTVKLRDGSEQPVTGVELPSTPDKTKVNDLIPDIWDFVNRIQFQKGLVLKKNVDDDEAQYIKWESATTADVTDYINPTAVGFEFKTKDHYAAVFDVSALTAAANIKLPNVSTSAIMATNETAWMLGGNVVTVAKNLGSTTDYDVNFVRNGANQFSLKSTGIAAEVDLSITKGSPQITLKDTGASVHTDGYGIRAIVDDFRITDLTHNKNILYHYLDDGTHYTKLDSQVFTFYNGGTLYANIDSAGLTLPTMSNSATDTDKFVVSDSGVLKYRTGAEILADIGAVAAFSGLTTNYHTKWNGTTLVNSIVFDNGTNVGIGTASPATLLDVRGQISVNAGTLANPAIARVGDLNTGVLFPADDTMALVTGGVNRLNVSSTGDIVIGSAAGTNSLIVSKNITGGTTASGIRSSGQIQSDVTSDGLMFRAVMNQANFALPILVGYESALGTINGTGTTLINFRAQATSANYTNVYGFQSVIASGTNRYNAYFNGTAQNFFRGNVGIGSGATAPTTQLEVVGQVSASIGSAAAPAFSFIGFLGTGIFLPTTDTMSIATGGTERVRFNSVGSVGIGTTSLTGISFRNRKSLTGAVFSYGNYTDGIIQSDVTSGAYYNRTQAETQAASFTLSFISHYHAAQGTIGAGSTVTNQYGFYVDNSLVGAASNIAFRGAIPSAANRWNIYMDGTAQNYIRGNVGIGLGKTAPAYEVDVAGTVSATNLRMTSGAGVGKILQSDASGNASWVTLGASGYLGTWNANTNTPTIANGTGTAGQFYIVSVAGTWGGFTFDVNDQVWYNGTIWQEVPTGVTIPTASASVSGIIKIGTGLAIDGGGVVSVQYGTSSTTAAVGDHTHAFSDITGKPTSIGGYGITVVAADIPTLNQNTTGSAASLATPRNIAMSGDVAWNVDFNGTANVSAVATLANSGVGSGTYNTVQVNSKGLVIAGSNASYLTGETDPVFVAWKNATQNKNLVWASSGITDGVAPTFRALVADDIPNIDAAKITSGSWAANTISATKGGTGHSSYTTGDLLYAATPTGSSLGRLASVAVGMALLSGGTGSGAAPFYGKVGLTTHISGVLPVANGGTGSATRNFVDLVSSETIAGTKTFTNNIVASANVTAAGSGVFATGLSVGNSYKVSFTPDLTYNAVGGTTRMQSGSATYFDYKPLVLTAKNFVMERGNLKLGGYGGFGFTGTVDFATERLEVEGNIRYNNGTLKPDNQTPTANMWLKAPTAATNAWAFITSDDITDHNAANKILKLNSSGLIDSAFLPAFIDDVLEYANLAAMPGTGESGKIYVALDSNKQYRWSGSSYVQITDGKATWGGIDGTLSAQTDLQAALNAKQNTLSGTASRITIASNVVDIASDYAGQGSITTVGAVTNGSWAANTISATKGGTGHSSYANGDLLYAITPTGSSLGRLASVAAGMALLSGGVGSGAAPFYGKVGLTTHIEGVLAQANGGTGSSTRNFVDLTSSENIAGTKTFTNNIIASANVNATGSGNFAAGLSVGNSYKVSFTPDLTYNAVGGTTRMQSGNAAFFDYKPLVLTAKNFVMERGNLKLGGYGGFGLTGTVDFATERLEVDGNIRYNSGTLKPDNQTPTANMWLKAPTTSTNAWAFITSDDITDHNAANKLLKLNSSGFIDSAYLPAFIDDVLEYANLSAMPGTGESGKIYVALDSNKQYRWSGSTYVQITDGKATWGGIDGTLSAQTDLQGALNAKLSIATAEATYQPLLPSGTSGQLLGKGVSGLQFLNLEINPLYLGHKRFAVGTEFDNFGEVENLTWENERQLRIGNYANSAMSLTMGFKPNDYDAVIDYQGLGDLYIKATRDIYFENFTGGGNRMLAVTSTGKMYATTIPSGGGGVGSSSLTADYIGFGDTGGVLSGSNTFKWIDGRIVRVQDKTTANRFMAFGYGFGATEAVLTSEATSGDALPLAVYAPSVKISSLATGGVKMVVVNAAGVLDTQSVPSGGGGVGTIDQVLAAGNTSYEKTLNFENTSTNPYIQFKNNAGLFKGDIVHVINKLYFNSYAGNGLQISSGADLDLLGTNINIGNSNTTGLINLQGMLFNFNENAQNSGSGQNGSQWGSAFNQNAPVAGDRMLFFYDGQRWVPSHVHTYAGAGGKTYLTID